MSGRRVKQGDAAERKREAERARYAANREARKAQSAAYRLANPEKVKAANKAYSKANREQRAAYGAAYRESHREESRLYAVSYRQRFAQKAQAAIAAWYAKNPDAMRIKKANRRARKNAIGGRLSRGLASRLLALQKGRCTGCRRKLAETGYHMDHVEALAAGGANEDRNMQLLCPRCNCTKGRLDPIVWARRLGRLL